SRGPDQLDVFVVGADGRVYTAAWDRHAADGKWQGWWRIQSATAEPSTPVTAVSRGPGPVDVLVVGADGGVDTTACGHSVVEGKWRGWWRIQDAVAAVGSRVAAVSRSPDQLDVFVVGTDGGVYTAAWAHSVADGKWRGWWRILSAAAEPSSPVIAVSRGP